MSISKIMFFILIFLKAMKTMYVRFLVSLFLCIFLFVLLLTFRLIDFDLTRFRMSVDTPVIVPRPEDQINQLGDVGAAQGPESLVKELGELKKKFQL